MSALAFQAIVTYLVIIDEGGAETPAALRYVWKVTICIVIFACVELVKSLTARLLSLRVLSEGMFNKLEVRT